MKKIIFIMLIIMTYFNINSFAQSITQSQKDSIIAKLYSDRWSEVYYATRSVVGYQIHEATSLLQNEIWNKNIKSRLAFIQAMFGLEVQNTNYYALALFDSLEFNSYLETDSVEIKLELVLILFQLDNYSKINYLVYRTKFLENNSDHSQIINLWG